MNSSLPPAMNVSKSRIMNKYLGSASAVLSSYGISLLSFIAGIDNFVGVISALAGSFLTVTMAMVRYSEYRVKMEHARKLKLENNAIAIKPQPGIQELSGENTGST